MSYITDLADAVVAELNGGSFSQSFTAVRDYLPIYELEALNGLKVTVVPKGIDIQAATRNSDREDAEVDVAVQQKLTDVDNATIDPLLTLVEELADHFRFKRLDSPDAVWIKTENQPVYAAEHLDQYRVLTSILTLTFRIVR